MVKYKLMYFVHLLAVLKFKFVNKLNRERSERENMRKYEKIKVALLGRVRRVRPLNLDPLVKS